MDYLIPDNVLSFEAILDSTSFIIRLNSCGRIEVRLVLRSIFKPFLPISRIICIEAIQNSGLSINKN